MCDNKIMRSARKICAVIVCMALMLCSISGVFQVFAAVSYKGSGTKSDPYLVETAEQLAGIKYNLAAHYKLANTIDLSSIANFSPVGNLETPFTGSFVCELNEDKTPKYVIKNLKITVEETADIGQYKNRWECALFGAADGAVFTGIYVLDVDLCNKNFGDNTGAVVYGDYKRGMDEMNCAALVGQANSCTITSCASTGAINGRASYSGGLIGYAIDSQISLCYSTATVTSETIFAVGGLMGCTRTSIVDRCYATGNVTGSNRAVAALVGSVYGSTYTNCYATGNVTGSALFVTNFTGDRESGTSSYQDCYAIGNVNSGRQDETSTVKNCWTLSGVKSNMKGFKEGSAAEINAAFASLSGWDTTGTYPALTDIGVVSDAASYQPGAVTSDVPSDSPSSETVTPGGETTTTTTTTTPESGGNVLEKFIEEVAKLPAAEKITADNLDQLVSLQELYSQLSDVDLIDLPSDVRATFENAKNAIQKDVLVKLKDGVEKLPDAKKVKASDKEDVLYLYNLYGLLTDDGKMALSPKLSDKLLACVEAVQGFEDSETSSPDITTGELIHSIVLTVLICCAIAFCVWNTIRTWRLVNRIKSVEDERELSDLDDADSQDMDAQ